MKLSKSSSVHQDENSVIKIFSAVDKLKILNANKPLTCFNDLKKPRQYSIINSVGNVVLYAAYGDKIEKRFFNHGVRFMILVDTLGNKIITFNKHFKCNLCSFEKIIKVTLKDGSLLATIRKEHEDHFTYRIFNADKDFIFYFYMGRNGLEHKLTKPDGITQVGKIMFSFPPAKTDVTYLIEMDNIKKALLLGIGIFVMNENVKALSNIQLE